MKRKNIRLKALTVGMTAILALQNPVMSLHASAAATQYLSEVIISYGRTDAEAKNWLTQNGYKVVGQNLNEGGEGGSEALSWMGLASEKRSVFLGYKTTTNPEEAITDMKIMNMNGGYSYEAYEKVLEDTKAEKEHFLENIMAALKEYRENYKKPEGTAGRTRAKIAHDALNKFKDDDSGALMGDLLLNTLKSEDEAAWEADPTQHADMVTILMQGNSTCVSEIMQNLSIAADTEDNSWLNRVLGDQGIPENPETESDEAGDEDETETKTEPEQKTEQPEQETETAAPAESRQTKFDTFFAEYQAQRPALNKDETAAELIAMYDDDAKKFASSLVGLQNLLDNYTRSELTIAATDEEATAYFKEHEFEDRRIWMTAANLYYTLAELHYGMDSLLDYLVYTDDDYLTDDALLDGYEALGLPQRAKLYPFVAAMSRGQRCLLEYTAMDRLVTMGLTDNSTLKSIAATMDDSEMEADKLEVCSVYADVNRDDFKVGEIAVTNAAQGKQASTGEQIDEGLFGVGISPLTAGIGIGGIVMVVAGIAVAVKSGAAESAARALANQINTNLSNGLPYKAVVDGKSILGGGFSLEAMASTNINTINYSTVDKMIFNINESVKGMHILADQVNSGKLTMDMLNQTVINFRGATEKLTVAGANETIVFDSSFKIGLKPDGTVDHVTAATGDVIYYDGRPRGVDQAVKENYERFMAHVNPDISKNLENVTTQLENIRRTTGLSSIDDMINQAEKAADYINTLLKTQRATDGKILAEHLEEYGHLYDLQPRDAKLRLTGEQVYNVRQISDNELDNLINYLDKKQSGQDELIGKLKEYKANRLGDINELAEKKFELERMQEFAKEDIAVRDELMDKADDAMSAASGSKFWKWFGVGMAIVGLIMSAYSVYAAIDEMQTYYHQEMIPIPRKMVDLGYYEDGTSCYIYYDCAKCNRTGMSMGNETLGDYGDLNGDVMKQWLALYTTKDTRAGKPILASITVKKGTTSMPMKTVPLSFFGFNSAVNMTDTRFTYNNAKNGIYLYYKTDGASYAGTAETGGVLVTTGVLSAIGGAGVAGLIAALVSKRKKKEEKPSEPAAA